MTMLMFILQLKMYPVYALSSKNQIVSFLSCKYTKSNDEVGKYELTWTFVKYMLQS